MLRLSRLWCPDKQYNLAWQEILCRYIYPRFIQPYLHPSQKLDPDQQVLQGIHKSDKEFNPGFEELRQIAQKANQHSRSKEAGVNHERSYIKQTVDSPQSST